MAAVPENLIRRPWRRRSRLAALLIAAMLAATGFRLGFIFYYAAFYDAARQEFSLPSMADGFVPQGMDTAEDGQFLISGYMAGSGAARIYRFDASGRTHLLRVRKEDGSPLICHAGGICVSGRFAYLAGGGGNCYVLSAQELFDDNSSFTEVLGVLRTANRASFCSVRDGQLLVGEYASGTRYPTDDTHHIQTPSGQRNTALILSYPLSNDAAFGVETEPNAAWSVRSRVQGICFTDDGRIVLSVSGNLNGAELCLYRLSAAVCGPRGILQVAGRFVPLYYLDDASAAGTIHVPPHSEEMVYVHHRLYILFESASNRFWYGKLIGTQYVYGLRIPTEL